ncbi:dCMP deaminase [Thermomonospora catenispora]|uniref:dCMP deaminase n=1 Tax=Thermomonospora catenispora TaxID=2493090 RepID=UPI0011204A49|nr:dCMP deaminase [Thermomonospora catenispora]TNY34452.1 dCMP deaminase [Thermomonospora catenispora]
MNATAPEDRRDRHWLALACDLARLCPPSDTAFSVGAVIVGADDSELARGWSRETDPAVHAEESALAKLLGRPLSEVPPAVDERGGGRDAAGGTPEDGAGRGPEAARAAVLRALGTLELTGATIYSSLEPCGRRLSRPWPCARLIAAAGIRRVVYAWREPSLFVEGNGEEVLRAAGVEVVRIEELADRAREPNAHLTG